MRSSSKEFRNQEPMMEEAVSDILTVFGKGDTRRNFRVQTPMQQILKYYKAKEPELPEDVTDLQEEIDLMTRTSGIMRRRVTLTGKWWSETTFPHLAFLKDGGTVALLPDVLGFYYIDETGNKIRINKKTCHVLTGEAWCFYRGYPLRPLKGLDVLLFKAQSIAPLDAVWVAAASLCVTLLGLVIPMINKLIFDHIIPGNLKQDVMPVAALLIGITVGSLLFEIFRNLIMSRLHNKMETSAQNAAMGRLFLLPVSFFHKHTAGELTERLNSMEEVSEILSDSVMSTILTTVFSFAYIFQMYNFAPQLALPGIGIILLMLVGMMGNAYFRMKRSRKKTEIAAKVSGMTFSLFRAVPKIKLTGSESRAFAKWGKLYARAATVKFNKPIFLTINYGLIAAITLIGAAVLYYIAATGNISQSDYIAFNTAFGAITGALLSMSGDLESLAEIRPLMQMAKPIYDAQPELAESGRQIRNMRGEIELSHVTFRYDEDMPPVVDDFSITIKAGEYVGIVGKSGCGKSTLMKLLIGFEKPESGEIFFDGEDMKELDIRSLRRQLGINLQDGKLFSGDIFSNITITAPGSTMEDAWEAAGKAGIAEDIRRMPQGMLTQVGEGAGSISAGQKQRILIARALIGDPKILMFDEATSSLDNVAQNLIAENLASLECTRLAIAHRLTTVQKCDRILMLDKGRILEEGTYEELMELKGEFYDFAIRQIESKDGE